MGIGRIGLYFEMFALFGISYFQVITVPIANYTSRRVVAANSSPLLNVIGTL